MEEQRNAEEFPDIDQLISEERMDEIMEGTGGDATEEELEAINTMLDQTLEKQIENSDKLVCQICGSDIEIHTEQLLCVTCLRNAMTKKITMREAQNRIEMLTVIYKKYLQKALKPKSDLVALSNIIPDELKGKNFQHEVRLMETKDCKLSAAGRRFVISFLDAIGWYKAAVRAAGEHEIAKAAMKENAKEAPAPGTDPNGPGRGATAVSMVMDEDPIQDYPDEAKGDANV